MIVTALCYGFKLIGFEEIITCNDVHNKNHTVSLKNVIQINIESHKIVQYIVTIATVNVKKQATFFYLFSKNNCKKVRNTPEICKRKKSPIWKFFKDNSDPLGRPLHYTGK